MRGSHVRRAKRAIRPRRSTAGVASRRSPGHHSRSYCVQDPQELSVKRKLPRPFSTRGVLDATPTSSVLAPCPSWATTVRVARGSKDRGRRFRGAPPDRRCGHRPGRLAARPDLDPRFHRGSAEDPHSCLEPGRAADPRGRQAAWSDRKGRFLRDRRASLLRSRDLRLPSWSDRHAAVHHARAGQWRVGLRHRILGGPIHGRHRLCRRHHVPVSASSGTGGRRHLHVGGNRRPWSGPGAEPGDPTGAAPYRYGTKRCRELRLCLSVPARFDPGPLRRGFHRRTSVRLLWRDSPRRRG